jgi:hypothetical protein
MDFIAADITTVIDKLEGIRKEPSCTIHIRLPLFTRLFRVHILYLGYALVVLSVNKGL